MFDYGNKVIVFAHPRSGSTSLCNMLNTHPSLHLSVEPFHEDYGKWNPDERSYIHSITDIPSLEQAISEIFQKYNGMKVLSYQLPEEIYQHLLCSPGNGVIFLTRTNILKAVVSVLIAEQTGVWQKLDLNDKTAEAYRQIKPLKIDGRGGIENRIKELKEHLRRWETILSQKPADSWMKVSYEELYCSGLTSSFSCVQSIFRFLELETPEREKLLPYLDPRKQQINDLVTYQLVPNIDEINRRFGNSETGFLF